MTPQIISPPDNSDRDSFVIVVRPGPGDAYGLIGVDRGNLSEQIALSAANWEWLKEFFQTEEQSSSTTSKRRVIMSNERAIQHVLGFGMTLVQRGDSAKIHVVTPVAFHPELLIIGDDVAADLMVTDLAINGISQLASAGAIPGDTFRASVDLRMSMARAGMGQTITLGILNKSGRSISVTASLSGRLL